LASRTLQHGQQFDGPVLCGSNPFFPIDSIQCQSKRFALTRFHNFLWIRPSWYFAADPELFPFLLLHDFFYILFVYFLFAASVSAQLFMMMFCLYSSGLVLCVGLGAWGRGLAWKFVCCVGM